MIDILTKKERKSAYNKSYRLAQPIEKKDEKLRKNREWAKTYRALHPEEARAKDRARHAARREKDAAYSRAYYVTHREELRIKRPARHAARREADNARAKVYRLSIRGFKRLVRYGLTQSAFDEMLLRQNGACATCGKSEWGIRGPSIDHDHKTGRIRGILCHKCNTALGMIQDDIKVLKSMIDYLEGELR